MFQYVKFRPRETVHTHIMLLRRLVKLNSVVFVCLVYSNISVSFAVLPEMFDRVGVSLVLMGDVYYLQTFLFERFEIFLVPPAYYIPTDQFIQIEISSAEYLILVRT